ncbi:CaiB/BaiF CoA transferase family protein [Euzebya tangerina]|uniref:CaiB/BaiF CoA transferase family protein n=1 Tax=Euzebya tangerina TaxID=591198 RepID=UPI000E310767|nr:CaiB/BaiF CoA-transferase family protein [Euzebya tangerina]
MSRPGPLNGLRVIEIQGIGPGPFAAMVLADLGAEVIRVDRTSAGGLSIGEGPQGHDVMSRSRQSVAINLKDPKGVEVLLALVRTADVLIEGFRPGVAERLGIGPDPCAAVNPGLVYGRMTGWGQTGPWATMAGHDLDYIALAGALQPMGEEGKPPPVPLNLIGDFGGGGMLLVVGVLAALVERQGSGQGQVVDAAMVDGSALLMNMFHGMRSMGSWDETRRAANLLDGGAPFYRNYVCADGGYVAVGALEPQFYAELLSLLDLDPAEWPQFDRTRWPDLARALAERFAAAPRRHWEEVFEGTDACVAPALTMAEAATHPHLADRETFIEVDGVSQAAPAPRFSRTPSGRPSAPPGRGADTEAVLARIGFDLDEIRALARAGAIATEAN